MKDSTIRKVRVSAVHYCALTSSSQCSVDPGLNVPRKYGLSVPGAELPPELAELCPKFTARWARNRYGLVRIRSRSTPVIHIVDGSKRSSSEVFRHMNEHWCTLERMVMGAPALIAYRVLEVKEPPRPFARQFDTKTPDLVGVKFNADDLFFPDWDNPTSDRIAQLIE